MKILQLRFKNLNSLSGEWTIDFTAPEYITDGIFAISGPTGAGKSTIMDAICLALYGRTPRLKGISKNTNEIMSRHTGECFSEVVFETQKGTFRCTWSQHRARKKANEELQNPSHEIADFQTGKIIESKLKTVAKAIEERTGMDFARFTQSMLLAQGGFAAFLQADPDERSPILEQITGSGIYTEISKLAFDRRRTENNKLDVLKAETAGIIILNEEDEIVINQNLIEKQNIEKDLASKKIALDKSILWLNGLITIEKEITEIGLETDLHSVAVKNFETERLMLQNGLKAANLDGEFASLSAKRKLQNDELGILEVSQKKVPEHEKNLELAIIQHISESNSLIDVKKAAFIEHEQIKYVRDVDIRISEKKKVLRSAEIDHKENLSLKIEKIKEKKLLQSKAKNTKAEFAAVENILNANINDAILTTELAAIKVQLKSLQDAKTKFTFLETQLSVTKNLHNSIEQQFKIQEKLVEKLGKDLTNARTQIIQDQKDLLNLLGERQLREYRADHAHLMKEMVYRRKISDLETERKQLTDHRPCPLCGSLHHPFAEGNIPETDEIDQKIRLVSELIDKADILELEQTNHAAKLQDVAFLLSEAEKELIQARNNKDAAQLAATNQINEKNNAFENYTHLSDLVAAILQPFGFADFQNTDPKALSNSLDARLKTWQYNQEQKIMLDGQINILSASIENINEIIKTFGNTLKIKLTEIIVRRKEIKESESQRSEIYGSKNPDTEELRITRLISEAEKLERESGDKKNKLTQELDDLNKRIAELISSSINRQKELDNDESTFLKSLQTAGFNDEPTFMGSRLSKEDREELSNQAMVLDLKTADLDTRRKDREARMTQEKALKLTEEPIDLLIGQQQTTGLLLNSIREDIGAIRQKLADNVEAKSRFGQKALLIEAQKVEFGRWDALSNLIGSADGKKYRNFAQGLTFEIMVVHANRQLMKLTDRYLLVRDKDQPLDLNVIDNYQAGEVRSTKNLSGGESFIISLALALGLSKMASKKVRVDSLFLDEGFGTLDEDTLETALDTLANLRQDGKLIGVISHVTALKERIATKIIVDKVSGGRSVISGPGCSRNN